MPINESAKELGIVCMICRDGLVISKDDVIICRYMHRYHQTCIIKTRLITANNDNGL